MPPHLPKGRGGGKASAQSVVSQGSLVEQVALHGGGQGQGRYLAEPGIPQGVAHTQAAQVQKTVWLRPDTISALGHGPPLKVQPSFLDLDVL